MADLPAYPEPWETDLVSLLLNGAMGIMVFLVRSIMPGLCDSWASRSPIAGTHS